ncbi:hypothetical protein TcasGA2_TC032278 [Tribolium castaneum]|uniref:Uncharacterized protein n=1 Tax=Tribolium castaneum TaxID=7070 RepID=A0A139W8T4_TRICA|nr:hypothetical protein TcasGA2_TC032278 [Tribolium castaneum]
MGDRLGTPRQLIYSEDEKTFRQRPYHAEYTSSRLITEVKQRRARLVLGWVTAWEHRVPLPPFLFYNALNKILGQLIYSEDEKTFKQRPYHAEYTSSRLITEVKQRRARQRPYHAEYTSSRLITEVKQRRARLVLGWVTAWEHRVPLPPFLFYNALNKILGQLIYSEDEKTFRQRPYHAEYTSSRLITEVKQRRARLVLGWVTAWEHRVPLPPFLFYNALNKILGQLIYSEDEKTFKQRPYHAEYTSSRLITEVKQRRARQRPYHAEYTSSRLITEVKQRRARLVLGWVTAWEHRVPLPPFLFYNALNKILGQLMSFENEKTFRQRPYHAEYTSSRLITEVKQRRARLVLGWVTAWEHRVPLPPFLFYNALNKILGQLIYSEDEKTFRQRPYHAEYTSSRLITEVKQRRARLVLGWVTAWEHRVPLPPFLFYNALNKILGQLIYSEDEKTFKQRPYHAEYTSSRLITEVKQRRARQRPYHAEYTSSRLITEVKQRRARLVLGWVTAWEHRVPLPPFLFYNALNKILGQLIYSEDEKTFRQRPYHAEYTSSRLITEVKQRRARLVLGWVTAWEHRVPLPPFLFYNALNKILGQLIYSEDEKTFRQRPYHAEYTSSRLITEVKQRRARLVLGWVTAWEHRVPVASFLVL